MLVVNRFRAQEGDAAFWAELAGALAVLAERDGYLDGQLGRNVDDPTLWTMVTRWRNVGSYRRALSSYEVKLGAVPLLSRALDEPSAYESVSTEGGMDGGAELNTARPRHLG